MLSRIVGASLLAVSAFAPLARAQNAAEPKMTFGILGGPNISTVSAGSDPYFEHRAAPMGGVFLNLWSNKALSLQPELLYWQTGARVLLPTPLGAPVADGSDRISYIDLPLLARAQLFAGHTVRPYVMAGPAVALRIGCTAVRGIGVTIKESCGAASENVGRTDFGVMGGAGVQIHAVSLGVQYDYGLHSLETTPDLKNRSIAFTAGFNLKSW